MPASDAFGSYAGGIDSPAVSAAAVTPHDTNELTFVTRGLYVGVTGNVVLTTVNGDTVTFVAVPAGAILPVRAKIVKSTNTTATSILALW